jgi:hypothetical protein
MITAEVHTSNLRAVAHRLGHAKWNGDRVRHECEPQAQRDRDRQLFLDQLQHRHIAEIALPEIEHGVALEHQEETLMRRLVEAKLLFQLLDELGVEALRAAILETAFGGCARACCLSAANLATAGATANARRGADVCAL